jgi:hypothetical protein
MDNPANRSLKPGSTRDGFLGSLCIRESVSHFALRRRIGIITEPRKEARESFYGDFVYEFCRYFAGGRVNSHDHQRVYTIHGTSMCCHVELMLPISGVRSMYRMAALFADR